MKDPKDYLSLREASCLSKESEPQFCYSVQKQLKWLMYGCSCANTSTFIFTQTCHLGKVSFLLLDEILELSSYLNVK